MIIRRVRVHTKGAHKGKEEVYEPKRCGRGPFKGMYQLAIKKTPYPLNHRENQVSAETLDEVADLVLKGCSLWMTGNLTRQRNLIAPDKIEIKKYREDKS